MSEIESLHPGPEDPEGIENQEDKEYPPSKKQRKEPFAQSKLDKYYEQVIASLKCPVCFDLSFEEGKECSNGHFICGGCFSELKGSGCPVCRCSGFHTNHFTRNFLSESGFMFPCKNFDLGCSGLLTISEYEHHKNECDYGLIDCPFCSKTNMSFSTAVKHIFRCFKPDGNNFEMDGIWLYEDMRSKIYWGDFDHSDVNMFDISGRSLSYKQISDSTDENPNVQFITVSYIIANNDLYLIHSKIRNKNILLSVYHLLKEKNIVIESLPGSKYPFNFKFPTIPINQYNHKTGQIFIDDSLTELMKDVYCDNSNNYIFKISVNG